MASARVSVSKREEDLDDPSLGDEAPCCVAVSCKPIELFREAALDAGADALCTTVTGTLACCGSYCGIGGLEAKRDCLLDFNEEVEDLEGTGDLLADAALPVP